MVDGEGDEFQVLLRASEVRLKKQRMVGVQRGRKKQVVCGVYIVMILSKKWKSKKQGLDRVGCGTENTGGLTNQVCVMLRIE